MTWTTDPATWVVGAVLTAAQLNTELRERMKYLKGTDGEIVFVDYPDFPSTAQGDVFYHDGTKLARLAAGTSGHLLKTQGAAANPIWASGATNAAAGLTPVATGWDTAPTTLTNLTDGDLTTVTGEGNRDCPWVETNNQGEITIDLGSIKAVSRIIAKFGIRSAGGITTSARLRAGEADSLADEQIGGTITRDADTEFVYYIQGAPASTIALVRYVSLRIWGGTEVGTDLSYLKIYEIIVNTFI